VQLGELTGVAGAAELPDRQPGAIAVAPRVPVHVVEVAKNSWKQPIRRGTQQGEGVAGRRVVVEVIGREADRGLLLCQKPGNGIRDLADDKLRSA
jgi:hypothetical protein